MHQYGLRATYLLITLSALLSQSAIAQFLTEGQISASQCAARSSDRGSGDFPLSVQYYQLNYGDSLPIELYHYHDSPKKKWSLQCLQLFEFGPPNIPSYLEETCAASAPIFELCYSAGYGNYDCRDISSYGVTPIQDLRFAGRDEPITFYKLRWRPAVTNTLATCYPRTLTVLIDTGLIEPEKIGVAAYIVVAIVGSIAAVVGIGVLVYLLHRRMNTFLLRGEVLGGQKNQTTEPYGPGDEDEVAKAKLEEQQRIASMSASPSYARRNEYEVEPGVFAPRRTELYGDLSHQSQLEQRQAHLVPHHQSATSAIEIAIAQAPDGSVVVAASNDPNRHRTVEIHPQNGISDGPKAPSIQRDTQAEGGVAFPGALLTSLNTTSASTMTERPPNPDVTLTLVPSTVNGAPSQMVYGPDYTDVMPYNPQGGPQSAMIEVEKGSKCIVSTPLRRPWHQQLRGEQHQHGGVTSPYRDPLSASILAAMPKPNTHQRSYLDDPREEEEAVFASPTSANSMRRNRAPPTESPLNQQQYDYRF